jgi:hypothetical protein
MESNVSKTVITTPETTSSGSTTQTVIIIILVVIGLILFFFLLIEFIFIPPVEIKPFQDGAIIKIKSLGNNQYLRALSCDEINKDKNFSCTSPCGSPLVLALGDGESDDFNWTLCQYQPTPKGSGTSQAGTNAVPAAYVITNRSQQQGTLITTGNISADMGFAEGFAGAGSCLQIANDDTICDIMRYLWNFVLIEANGINVNATNIQGTYFIHGALPSVWVSGGCPTNICGSDCPNNVGNGYYYFYCNGSRPANCNVPVVQLHSNTIADNDSTTSDQILNYSFEIQVVGSVTKS